MMRNVNALIAGSIFGIGLTISQMVNPAVVRGFLDFAGDWNPALIFTLGGAMLVSILAWQLRAGRQKPKFADQFPEPARTMLDRDLILGAILFGIGWGLVGLCPGPAIAGLTFGVTSIWIFIASMMIGFFIQKALATKL